MRKRVSSCGLLLRARRHRDPFGIPAPSDIGTQGASCNVRVQRSVENPASPGYIARMSDEQGHEAAEKMPILLVPHPALKAKARRVAPEDRERVAALVPRMFRTMYEAPGIGLAATQVGENLRLAVVDLQPDEQKQPIVLVNPEIVAIGPDQATREEGCLSLPNIYADVTRPARVTVRFEDETGTRRTLEAEGLLAACLQHEIDHLDGVLFVDHLSALKRNMLLRRHAKERRQTTAA